MVYTIFIVDIKTLIDNCHIIIAQRFRFGSRLALNIRNTSFGLKIDFFSNVLENSIDSVFTILLLNLVGSGTRFFFCRIQGLSRAGSRFLLRVVIPLFGFEETDQYPVSVRLEFGYNFLQDQIWIFSQWSDPVKLSPDSGECNYYSYPSIEFINCRRIYHYAYI